MQRPLFDTLYVDPHRPFGSFRHKAPEQELIRTFQSVMLDYYESHGRPFPWRETRDPYLILVSEIMLQQTQTHRVENKWDSFVERFPNIFAMAEAPFPDILELWKGMGYNRRARALKDIAMRVVDEFDANVPNDVNMLSTFPMIGVNTASAICAFAFDSPTVFLETNLRRVFLYFFFDGEDKVTDREIMPIVERSVYRADPRTWYYALMDYGVFLKKALPNQNVRSAHYTKQRAFENSDRQLRGRILRSVMDQKSVDLDALVSTVMFDEPRVRKCAYNLVDEGLLVCENGRFSLSQ